VRKSLYYHYYDPGAHNVAVHYGVRTEQSKLIYYPKSQEWELFDLKRDPHEMTSVYADPKYASELKKMKRELERLRRQYKDSE
jgi:arylsulfatase A-like enzyme